ncbi:hypothetical protein A4X13_0g9372 [Tilletia indica]|uniref:Uncharacterized protein n=1 Tax=Tilletia indica TaxID=43049 RepID=A0A8T8S9Z5_9BASI|nr:hypothetical protein A4X13_0g9372 [Tilletia indica]
MPDNPHRPSSSHTHPRSMDAPHSRSGINMLKRHPRPTPALTMHNHNIAPYMVSKQHTYKHNALKVPNGQRTLTHTRTTLAPYTLAVSRTGQIPYPHERISCLLNSASAPASTFQILNAQPRFTATSFLLPSTATTPASLKETWIFRTSTQISSCSSFFINYPPFAFDVSKFTL